MARLFGTDGVRGVANRELTGELAFKLGQAGAQVLTSAVHRPRILIGRDTRISGEMLLYALAAGICSAGAEAVDVGVIPTPGIAYLTRTHDADAGVVISASHNSFEFNGIKWFNGEGFKLSDALEDEIEALIRSDAPQALPTGEKVGRMVEAARSAQEYMDFLAGAEQIDLSGLKIALDCANGAASPVAAAVFERLGATVLAYFDDPDGSNINANCGSTHPKRLQQLVVEQGADVGLAFDGDADRLIAVDEHGVLVDGDRIMTICAMDMKERGVLQKNTLVATVMSNLGMIHTLQDAGIRVELTDVGDRYVLEKMQKEGYNFGGEQSGHLIFLEKNTTGDGMLSALELLSVMVRKKKKLSELSGSVRIYPQVLVNVQVPNEKKYLYKEEDAVLRQIASTERKLEGKGRVLVRTSGTEPLVRIMLEGENEAMIEAEAVAIATLVAERFGGSIR